MVNLNIEIIYVIQEIWLIKNMKDYVKMIKQMNKKNIC